ncbi:MAG: lamin tail domain-containing protein [Deinococcus sp.]|nr:lamin tail domain-containing protein [Deinococcus sp.]
MSKTSIGFGIVLAAVLAALAMAPAQAGPSGPTFTEVSLAQGNQVVEITNFSDSTADLTGWFLCSRPNYVPFPNGTTIAPGGILLLHVAASGTNDAGNVFLSGLNTLGQNDEIALYRDRNFSSSSSIVSFVSWGGPGGSSRQSVAVAAGLWVANEFVPAPGADQTIARLVDSTAVGTSAWAVGAPTLGAPNASTGR